MRPLRFKVLILGAGSGGISVAARLRRPVGTENIGIIEPAESHFYQPLWTLVGAGLVKKEKTRRPMKSLIPKGVEWIRDSAARVDPTNRKVICASGKEVGYDFLVVATGLALDWHKIEGLDGNLGQNGICSIYQYADAESTSRMLQDFKGGEAIFTMPPVPIKCAGAPQKIMYLADEIFARNGVRKSTRITYAAAGKGIFGVPVFAQALLEVASRKQIHLDFSHKLIRYPGCGEGRCF